MNHDPFKISEAILDLWRDLKAAEDDIEGLEIRNASLVKELDELRASSFVTAVPVEQYELVIEAGDALAREICILGPVDDKEKKAIDAWNAAKEGKQP